MTNPNKLISKYLKEIDARMLPDGSLHPDDLREAEFLATIELLETGEIEPPENFPPLSDREAARAWIKMAMLHGNWDSVLDFIAHAVNKHDAQVRNAPTNPGRTPDPKTLKAELDVLLAKGLTRSSAIQRLADKYNVETDTVRKRLWRGRDKRKK